MTFDFKTIIDIISFILWLGFGGWAMYWKSQLRDLEKDHSRTVEDMKELKVQSQELRGKWEAQNMMMMQSYVTRDDHYKFEDKVVQAIEKLGTRIDTFMGRYVVLPDVPKQ